MTIVVARSERHKLVLEARLNPSGCASITTAGIAKPPRSVLCSKGYRGFIEASGGVRFGFRDPQTAKTTGPELVVGCQGV